VAPRWCLGDPGRRPEREPPPRTGNGQVQVMVLVDADLLAQFDRLNSSGTRSKVIRALMRGYVNAGQGERRR
jgi:hypothetical protein